MEPTEPQPVPEDIPQAEATAEVVEAVHAIRPRDDDSLPHGRFMVLIIAYAVVDFLGPLLFASGGSEIWPLVAAWSGALFGQGAFLVIWAVLGPFRLHTRWAMILLIAFLLYFSSCFGGLLGERRSHAWNDLPEIAACSLFIPLLFLILQIPLWIRRVISGWQIVPDVEVSDSSANEARQFSLAHILGLMVYLAVSMSLIHMASEVLIPSGAQGTSRQVAIWLGLGMNGGILCIYLAVWLGPALRACFLARDKSLGCGVMVLLWLAVSALVVLVPIILGLIFDGSMHMPFEAVAAIFLHFGTMVSVLMVSLYLLRECGYTMIRTKRRRRLKPSRGPLPIANSSTTEGECPFAEQPPTNNPESL